MQPSLASSHRMSVSRQPVIRVCEEAGAHRFLQLLQPSSDGLAVEYRLARHAPHAEAVDLIVIFVRLLKALQRPYGRRIQKAVVLVGALVHPCSFVPPVKKTFLQPVLNADRVEAQDDLLVLPRLSAQSDVQLVEVSLQQLAGLFNPDARDVVDGFQLLNVIQSRKDDLAAFWKEMVKSDLLALYPLSGRTPPAVPKAA